MQPLCPQCGTADGTLGTSFAYFICRQCKTEVYWTPDHRHPGDWQIAIDASPWAVVKQRLTQAVAYRPEPTMEEVATILCQTST